ncbi:unnamed protein product [Didymodactylos carnosus]|nr:unnamed protein product [Didymodactylos carnosus]
MAKLLRIPTGRTTLSKNDTVTQEFIGIWLHSISEDNSTTHSRLKSFFDYLVPLQDICECIAYVVKIEIKQIFLIVSARLFKINFIKSMISLIHNRTEIQFIYISCEDTTELDEWVKQEFYTKVQDRVYIDENLLFEQLEKDLPVPKQLPSTKEERRPLSLFKNKDKDTLIRNLSEESVAFIRYQLLIEILLRMPLSDKAKRIMLEHCRKCYDENDPEQTHITEFEKTYRIGVLGTAIHWYSRQCFLNRLLAKALSTQDANYLYTFRFIISELHNELRSLNSVRTQSLPSKLFRGKVLSTDTLEDLKKNVEGLVSMIGFFSATTNPAISDIYAGTDCSLRTDQKHVVFNLYVKNGVTTKPFASIRQYSAMPHEDEILFSVGTVWRILNVKLNENGVWNIELELSKEDDERCIELSEYLKKQIGEIPTLLTLGNFLSAIGQHEKAEKHYRLLLDELPKDHKDIGVIYNNIGFIRYENKDFCGAEDWFRKAQNFFENMNKTDNKTNTTLPHLLLSILKFFTLKNDSMNKTNANTDNKLHVDIANYNHDLARSTTNSDLFSATSLKRHNETLECITKSLQADHSSSVAILVNNKGLIHYKRGDYTTALTCYIEALKILNENNGRYPPDISAVHNNIGAMYFKTDEHAKALENFDLAVKVGLELLPPTHKWIIEYTNNKAAVLKHINSMSKHPKLNSNNRTTTG